MAIKIYPNILKIKDKDGNLKSIAAIGGGESNVQSDWLQEDTTAADYIKNKPKEITDEEMISMLTEVGAIIPIISNANAFYTNSQNQIFVL